MNIALLGTGLMGRPIADALKLALNQLIAAEMAAFALSLGLIQRAEISPRYVYGHSSSQRAVRSDI